MLGPFGIINHPDLHCSLLIRPKDNDKRREILKLSYPTGASINDEVTKDLFDGLESTLRFPIVDDIMEKVHHSRAEYY